MRAKLAFLTGGALLVGLLVLGGLLNGRYGTLTQANENIDAAWTRVETQLQRRADLIPDLVQAAKGYVTPESEILHSASEAGHLHTVGISPAEAARVDADTGSAVDELLSVVDDYPDLETDQEFRSLREAMQGAENRIALERRNYNQAVSAFNASLDGFPNRTLAGIFDLKKRERFESKRKEKKPIQIGF